MKEKIKKSLAISALIFFVVSTIGVVVALNENTSIFRSATYVTCQFNYGQNYGQNFTISIPKKGDKILWQGTDRGRERKVELVSETSLKMTWKSDDGANITFVLNRLTGDFSIETSAKKGEDYGSCREATPKF